VSPTQVPQAGASVVGNCFLTVLEAKVQNEGGVSGEASSWLAHSAFCLHPNMIFVHCGWGSGVGGNLSPLS
jgi:hypothetical protein